MDDYKTYKQYILIFSLHFLNYIGFNGKFNLQKSLNLLMVPSVWFCFIICDLEAFSSHRLGIKQTSRYNVIFTTSITSYAKYLCSLLMGSFGPGSINWKSCVRVQLFIMTWNNHKSFYKQEHIDASVKERPQTLLVPSEEICKRVLCNKHI